MIKIGISKTTFVKALQTRNITQFLSLLRENNNPYANYVQDILSSIKIRTVIEYISTGFNMIKIFLKGCKIEPKE